MRGSDDRAVGVACIFANLRNEVLGGFTSSYRRRRSRRARQRQNWVVPQSSCLLIDNTAAAHLPGPQNLRECHLHFAEGCHLYIALTNERPISSDYGKSPWGLLIGDSVPVAPDAV